jgi:NADH-quinone oxidoreductase subunit I
MTDPKDSTAQPPQAADAAAVNTTVAPVAQVVMVLKTLKDVPTQCLMRFADLAFFKKIIFGFVSLLKGMRITFGYLIDTKTVVTQQYPENRETLKLSDRVRAQLEMNHDEKGYHKCTSCHICEEACPNGSIHVVDRKTPTISKKELGHFVWRMDTCTFCNLCVLVCPFSCLKMNSKFESSVFDQRLLVYNLNKYSGPTAPILEKQPDDESRAKAIQQITPYEGPVALEGYFMAGLPKEFHLEKPADVAVTTATTEVRPS